MALETSTYINGLVATNPTSSDNVGDGDNHIRLLKSTIKATFPNVSGAVSSTHTAINSAVTDANNATNANTASRIVKRDGSGNFSAGTITATFNGNVTGNTVGTHTGNVTGNVTGNTSGSSGSCTGNSATATKWANARTITLGGDASGSVSIDGTANQTLTVTVNDDSHNHTIANIDGLQSSLNSKATLLQVYPVGAIYISTASTNPSSLFGGTWVAFGQGRVLVGLNSSDSDFNQSEETGGAKTNSTSITVSRDGWGNVQSGNRMQEPNVAGRLITGDGSYEDHENLESLAHASADKTFSGSASTLQPYIVAYMFKRTS